MRRRSAVAAGLWLVAMLGWGCQSRPELSPQEVARYASNISFSNFRLSAAENLAGHTIYYIDAAVKNGTGRPISVLQVRASFQNSDGLVVFREPATVVRASQAPLGPGQSREFRMAFEGIPESWDRTAPRLEITRLVLQ